MTKRQLAGSFGAGLRAMLGRGARGAGSAVPGEPKPKVRLFHCLFRKWRASRKEKGKKEKKKKTKQKKKTVNRFECHYELGCMARRPFRRIAPQTNCSLGSAECGRGKGFAGKVPKGQSCAESGADAETRTGSSLVARRSASGSVQDSTRTLLSCVSLCQRRRSILLAHSRGPTSPISSRVVVECADRLRRDAVRESVCLIYTLANPPKSAVPTSPFSPLPFEPPSSRLRPCSPSTSYALVTACSLLTPYFILYPNPDHSPTISLRNIMIGQAFVAAVMAASAAFSMVSLRA